MVSDPREYVIRRADSAPCIGRVYRDRGHWCAFSPGVGVRNAASADEAESVLVAEWRSRGAEVYRLAWGEGPGLVRVK